MCDANSIGIFNPFVPNAPFLYLLKTPENLTVLQCFQGLEKGWVGKEWVKESSLKFPDVLS